jgi:sugar lactone lactonase YvrE
MPTPTLLVDGLAFPETPRWHDGRLYFSDMDDNQVKWVDEAGHTGVVVDVASRPSGLGWLPDGRLLVVSMHDLAVLRLDDHGLTTHADLRDLASFHTNDMAVTPSGRAYVGNFGWNPRGDGPERETPLIIVEPNGTARHSGEALNFPNGIVLNAELDTLVVAESRGKRLTKFRVGDDGSLHDRALFADLGTSFPDGICIDAEGAVWAALIFDNAVARFDTKGRETHRISTGDLHAYACMLGGADRRTLYICSASTSEPGDAARLRHGRISGVRVDVPGAGCP